MTRGGRNALRGTELAGKRVLLVEDEYLVAALAEDMLVAFGALPIGPALKMRDGLSLARSEAIDVAVLDININGERSDGIADILRDRGIPFIFATGYGDPQGDFEVPLVQKPYTDDMLFTALARALAGGGRAR